MAKAEEEIFIQIGDEVIELLGEEKSAFITQRNEDAKKADLLKAEEIAREAARQSALAKLAELGLTEEEINAL